MLPESFYRTLISCSILEYLFGPNENFSGSGLKKSILMSSKSDFG